MWRHNTVAGIGTPQLARFPDSRVDGKLTVLLSESESGAPPSSSNSTVSRFMGRFGGGVSRRPIPSWRSSADAQKTYAKIDSRHNSEDSDSPDPPHYLREMVPYQHTSSGYQRRYPLRGRHEKRTSSTNDIFHASIPFPSLLARFPHARTMKNGHHDPDRSSSSSLNTYQSPFDSHVPFPSISEESYPSPYSPDAVAVFQIPLDAGEAPPFDCFVEHNILKDEIQVTFSEDSDRTSTSTGATSLRPASARRGLLASLKQRVGALASSVRRPRCKLPTIFHIHRHPNPVDDDDNPLEYDIPCLAYITCLW